MSATVCEIGDTRLCFGRLADGKGGAVHRFWWEDADYVPGTVPFVTFSKAGTEHFHNDKAIWRRQWDAVRAREQADAAAVDQARRNVMPDTTGAER